ncbi:MAG TPA: hypothetical protein VKV77_05955 [Methylovirgula sp.]|nr:hypothetical protein [Methylovirgula sp.]
MTRFVRFIGMIMLVLAFCAAPARAQGVPGDEAGFTAYVANAFQKLAPNATVRIAGPLHLTIKQNGQTWETHLGNIYSYCRRNSADECAGALELHLDRIVAAHNEGETRVSRSDLRVVVRQKEYVDEIKEHLGDSGDPIAEPLCADLWVLGVADQPDTIRMLQPSDLTALDLSPDEILALAKQNTKAEERGRVPTVKDAHKGEAGVLIGDTYTASLFAFPELWAPLAHAFGGLIVTAPSSDQLLFMPDDGPGAAAALRKIAEVDFETAMRPLSQAVCRWTENGWVEVSLPQK